MPGHKLEFASAIVQNEFGGRFGNQPIRYGAFRNINGLIPSDTQHMEVYLVEDDDMRRVPESDLDAEEHLEQRLVRTDGAEIGGVEILYVGRQESPGEGGIFDILGVDEHGDSVIVELKRDRAPRDIVAQALEYAAEIRNVEYEYLNDMFREFIRDDFGLPDSPEVRSLGDAHQEYFDLEEPLSKRDFNDAQRMVVVGTSFQDVSLNMADFLREHGIDVVAVEYTTYQTEDGVELLTTDGIRRPLSDEPSAASGSSDRPDYSELNRKIRDLVFREVGDITGHETPKEMSGRAPRRFGISSNHPEHPDPVLYQFIPRVKEEDQSILRISLWGGEEHEKQQIREEIRAHSDELDDFNINDDPGANSRILYRTIETGDTEGDNEFAERVAQEMARLVKYYHPKLVGDV